MAHSHPEPKNVEQWAQKEFDTHPTSVLYKHENPLVRFIERRRQDMVVDTFRRFVQNKPYRVLEIACQEGYTTRRLGGPRAKKVVGIDLVEDALKVARRINPSSHKFIKANAEKMPFKDGEFDVVIASEALEHMFHPDKVIRECRRVLRPGGLLVITVPYEVQVVRVKKLLAAIGVFKLFFPDMFAEQSHYHVQSYSPKSLRVLLRKEGMTTQRTRLIPFPFVGPKIYCTSRA